MFERLLINDGNSATQLMFFSALFSLWHLSSGTFFFINLKASCVTWTFLPEKITHQLNRILVSPKNVCFIKLTDFLNNSNNNAFWCVDSVVLTRASVSKQELKELCEKFPTSLKANNKNSVNGDTWCHTLDVIYGSSHQCLCAVSVLLWNYKCGFQWHGGIVARCVRLITKKICCNQENCSAPTRGEVSVKSNICPYF